MPPKLIVEVLGDTSRLEKSFKRASGEAKGFGSSLGSLSVGFGQLVKGVIIVDAVQKALEGLHATVHLGIEEFSEHAKVSAQTEAALKSTGGVANVTAKQIDELGLSLSNLSGVDDEVVQSGANVLLAFQNIRDFAGKGNQIFTEATKAALDFSVRSGRSVPAAAVAIGRALQDPAKAAGSLRRAYVVLTASEKSAIATAVAHGDTLKAQRLIIGDLEKRYGGAAKAIGQTLPGQLNVLRDRFKDLAGSLVGVFVPATTKAVTGLTDFVKTLSETKGTRAKLDFTIDTAKNTAKDLFEKLRAEFDSVDWAAVAKTAQDGLRAIGPAIAHAIGRIDFAAVGRALGHGLKAIFKFDVENFRIIGHEIAAGFKQINFGAIGRDLGNAVSRLLDYISAAARKVDWNKVGRALVRGAEAIVVAVARFLAGVDWGRVLSAIGRLIIAAAEGIGRIWLGIGEQLGKDLLKGIGKGLDSAGTFLERKAIKIVLGILDPFTSIPGWLGPEGGLARDLKDKLHATLDGLNKPSAADGAAVGTNFMAGIIGSVETAQADLAAAIDAALAAAVKPTISHRDRDFAPPEPPAPKPPQRKAVTASQRNTFFDNAISSDLTRAGLLPKIKDQIAALQRVAALIQARIAATKDVTRRRTLEDQLLQVQATIRGDQQQVGQDFLASLQFGITKAQATATFKDDLAALAALKAGIQAQIKATGDSVELEQQLFDVTQQINAVHAQVFQQRIDLAQFRVTKAEATPGFADDVKALTALQDGIKAQIKATGDTLELEQQLFGVQQQLAAAKQSALSAKEFKQLGLGPTGEDIIPGKKALKKELGDVQGLISGTILDTSANKALLAKVAKVLTNALVPPDVRAKLKSLLDDLLGQLDGHLARLTKFQHESSAKFAASIPGLTPAQVRAVRAAFAGVGPGGTVPSHGPAFGGATPKVAATTAPPRSSGSPRSPSTTYILNRPQFHGVTDVAKLESALAKRAGRRAPRRD